MKSRNLGKRLLHGAIASALLTGLALILQHSSTLKQLEQLTLDLRFQHLSPDSTPSEKVVVIDIDEESMKLLGPHYGRWPWPRKIYQEMIDFLAAGEPSAILFDLLFTEAELNSNSDELLAKSTAAAGSVSHAMLFLPKTSDQSINYQPQTDPLPGDLPKRFGIDLRGNASWMAELPDSSRFLLPAPAYLPLAPALHVVTTETDADGVYRRILPAFRYDQDWFPSLSLRAVLRTLKNPKIESGTDGLILRSDDAKPLSIPLEPDGRMRVRFSPRGKDLEIIPMATVIESASALLSGKASDPSALKVNPLQFTGKIILIGGSAAGLEDLKATPVNPSLPGVLIHASAISNILKQEFIRPISPEWVSMFCLLTILIIYASLLLFESFALKSLIPLLWIGAWVATALILFRSSGMWLELARPLAIASLALTDGFAYLILIEGREKKKLKGALMKYLPPALADQMIADGIDPKAEIGTRRELSILFSDIRGFTTLSESLEAEKLVAILNEYLGRMTGIVFQNLGTLDKFIGDAVMAFWGAPLPEPDHALRAVRTAVRMRQELAALNADWSKRGIAPLAIGVGINTGEVIVGNIGSDQRLDYTVIGDHVNLASRLEGLTKQYHLELVIGPRTEELIRGKIIVRPVDWVRVKGKNEPVRLYEPLVEAGDPAEEEALKIARATEEALAHYQAGRFNDALSCYEAIRASTKSGDGLAEVFIERCRELILNPPADWDGVFTAKSK
ncbi:MAG: adenylate/guanylate cyclase domain-containing protein [Proteobacteria bacterium]|nr:adenylate/guanylate cyclase domain-containing protein [Pseudomonadota bacterium]